MPRPPRMQYSDAVYHVMSRGNNRQNIFRRPQEFEDFLSILGEACGQYFVKVSAYCLMPNHYHLLVRTPDANLADFMKRLNGIYAQRLNYFRGQDGHVFQGRYKSILVEKERYLLSLVRYIHLNPVEAKIACNLDSYPYSSHHCYLKSTPSEWFDGPFVTKILTHDLSRSVEIYREYMNLPVEEEIDAFYKRRRVASILGGPEFKEWVKISQKGSDPRV